MLVRIPYPYTEWQTVHVFPYGEVAYDLDISPDGSLVSTSHGRARLEPRRGAGHAGSRDVHRRAARRATRRRCARSSSAAPRPKGSCSRRTAGTCSAAPTTPAFRTSTATRSSSGETRGGEQRRDGLLPPGAVSDTSCSSSTTPRAGSCRRRSGPTDRGPERDHVPRRADRDPATRLCRAGVHGRRRVSTTSPRQPPGDLPADTRARRRVVYPDRRGLQGLRGARRARALQRPSRIQHRRASPRATVPTTRCRRRNGPLRRSASGSPSGRLGLNWNAGDFYDLFGPTKRSREGYSGFVGYDRPLIYSPRRR